jgi:hypothetical protein
MAIEILRWRSPLAVSPLTAKVGSCPIHRDSAVLITRLALVHAQGLNAGDRYSDTGSEASKGYDRA